MTTPSIGRLLIVDDELEPRTALREMLSGLGYETAEYSSGKEALAALEGRSFDLLLADLMMPDMDGIAMIGRALEIDPEIVGLIVTEQDTVKTAVQAIKGSAFDYVLKPFKLSELLPVLSRALDVRRLRVENVQLRETVAIYELSQTVAFTLDSQVVLHQVVDAALQLCQADEASIMLPSEDGSELYVAAARGGSREEILGKRVPVEAGIAGWVARQRQAVALQGRVNDPRFAPIKPREQIRSSISMPMLLGNEMVGVLNVNATRPRHPYTSGQMSALSILVNVAASALQTASLYERVSKAEEKYRSIFDNAVEGIYRTTPDGHYVAANPTLARILGYESPAELMAGVLAQQHYVDPNRYEQLIRLVDERGIVLGFESEVRRKDGTVIWAMENMRCLRDPTGKCVGREGSMEDVTEHKRAEQALLESEERFSSLAKVSPVGIFRTDPQGHYVYMNERWCAITGLTPGEALGEGWSKSLHPDDRDWVVAGWYEAAHQNSVFQAEYRFRRPDGITTWVLGQAATEVDQSGRVRGFVGTITDITDQRQAQAEMRESEHKHRMVLDNIDEIVYLVSNRNEKPNEAVVEFVSSRVKTMLGYEPREFMEDSGLWLRLIHPDDLAGLVEATRKLFADHQSATRHYRIRTKTGEYRWIEDEVAIRTTEDGAISQFGVARDITERKAAEEAVRTSEQRYREIFENANDIICTLDLQGNYTSFNNAGERITGYTRDEVLGMNLARLAAPEDRETALQMIGTKLIEGGATTYELEMVAKDGRRIPLEVSTRLMYREGKPIGKQCIARDLTHRKQLEEQFRQAQKMEGIGRLASGVAHDFNNLLTAIIGYSQLALSRIEPADPLRRELEEIRDAGARAAQLTSQLLAFSRKQVREPKVLDLNSTVVTMSKMLQRVIGEDIEMLTKLDLELGSVKADPGQMEQVIMNLAVNARDAMAQGGKLTIETANVDLTPDYARSHHAIAPGRYVMLALSDTGCGMDAETQSLIFEPFFTTKAQGKGTGLGLATVYGIVNQSRGHIWVYSEQGLGTTFKIYLPRLDRRQDAAQQTERVEPIPQGTETVLLVEDEQFVRTLAATVLRGVGYTVLEAAGGEEALQVAREHAGTIRLLLTDVVMPQISGRDLAEQLKAERPDIAVLFASGYTDDAIAQHGVLEPGMAFLQKPFTPTSLARKVREVLEGRGAD